MCYQKNTMIFHGDNPNGSMNVACSNCGEIFNNEKNQIKGDYSDCKCPDCDTILSYPKGVDW